jgi:hypothetical protein
MATYTVLGHPISPLPGMTATQWEQLRAAMQLTGVGGSLTITLSGGDDTTAKGHGILK